eukprot:gnl/MRDRNA2_/MRDRNA2_30236_c0_seq1.p1 gnl/MRDRNA2_/MRDRNA2_30236_c0~~gnl/MRDRNA2_/MRDRNA2_30236_c0_seq1.p1  ORF type:complete len:2959 (-),score=667.55 gnl/MRDRNA2_/MRDRNA2_30236_c0_seq1:52-7932(-)
MQASMAGNYAVGVTERRQMRKTATKSELSELSETDEVAGSIRSQDRKDSKTISDRISHERNDEGSAIPFSPTSLNASSSVDTTVIVCGPHALERLLPRLQKEAETLLSMQRGKDLLRSVALGDLNQVRNLLRLGAALNYRETEDQDSAEAGWTALHFAAKYGRKEIASALVERKADVLMCTDNLQSPLHIAAGSSATEICAELCARRADVNARDINEATPLHLAGSPAVAECLAGLKADLGAKTSELKTTLHGAVERNDADLVSKLLRMSADVRAQMRDGTEPQHLAAQKGHLEVLELLLADKTNCAHVANRDGEGRTALWLASSAGHLAVCSRLIQSKAAAQTEDQYGVTPLMIASERGHADVVMGLLDAKASTNGPRQRNGYTALALAVRQAHQDVVKTLITGKAKVGIQDTQGYTCLYHARAVLNTGAFPMSSTSTALPSGGGGGTGETDKRVSGRLQRLSVVATRFSFVKLGASAMKAVKQGLKVLEMSGAKGAHMQVAMDMIDALQAAGASELRSAAMQGNLTKIKLLVGSGNQKKRESIANVPKVPSRMAQSLPPQKIQDKMLSLLEKPAEELPPTEEPETQDQELETDDIVAPLEPSRFRPSAWSGISTKFKKPLENDENDDATDGLPVHCLNLEGDERRTALMICSERGDVAICQHLLEVQADANFRNSHGAAALLFAAWEGHLAVAELLVNAGASVNFQDDEWYTPLIAASDQGHEAMVNFLLAQAADLELPLKVEGLTALYCAVAQGHSEIARMLMDADASVHHRAKMGRTALMLAASKGNAQMTKQLILYGASVTTTDVESWAAVHFAADRGALEVVKILIEYQADPMALTNSSDTALTLARNGMTPGHNSIVPLLSVDERSELRTAAQQGDVNKIKELAERRAMLDQNLTEDGESAMHICASHGHTKALRALIARGAAKSRVDGLGRTPLHCAAITGHLEALQFLVGLCESSAPSVGASQGGGKKVQSGRHPCNRLSLEGHTVLGYAIEGEHAEAAQFLVESDAGLEVRNSEGLTALMQALQRSKDAISTSVATLSEARQKIALMLMTAGAKINERSTTGAQSPIMMAASLGDLEVMTVLKQRGGSFLDTDNNGFAPMSFAAQAGHSDACRLLRSWGAPFEVRTNDGRTPLMLAAENGHLEVCMMLKEVTAKIAGWDNAGNSATTFARQNGHETTEAFLVKWAAECARIAVPEGQHETLKLLTPHDIHLDWPLDEFERGALHLAADIGDFEIAKYLCEAKANMDVLDTDGCTPVILAAKRYQEPIIKLLIEKGCELTVTASDSMTSLMHVAWHGDQFIISDILACPAVHASFVNQQDSTGRTALMIACERGHVAAAQALVFMEAQLIEPVTSDGGNNAMFLAALEGKTEVIQGLLEWENSKSIARQQLKAANREGRPLALLAALNGHSEVVTLIHSFGGNLDDPDSVGQTVAHYAAKAGSLDILQLVAVSRGDVSKHDTNGMTPLILAARQGYHKIVSWLLENGVWPLDADNDGMTPVMHASYEGHLNVLEALEKKKPCGLHLQNKKGHTALSGSLSKGEDHQSITNFLLAWIASLCKYFIKHNDVKAFEELMSDHTISIDMRIDDENQTSLLEAARTDKTEMVESIIKQSAAVDVQDAEGNTALMWAVTHATEEAAKVMDLLLAAAQENNMLVSFVNLARNDKQTALHIGAEKGICTAIVKLLQAGLRIDKVDERGATALFVACDQGNNDAVKELLENQAGVDIGDNDGVTPLMAAARDGRTETCDILLPVADHDIRDKQQRTCVHWAAAGGQALITRFFLDYGLRIDVQDMANKSPLTLAAEAPEEGIEFACSDADTLAELAMSLRVAAVEMMRKRSVNLLDITLPCYTEKEEEEMEDGAEKAEDGDEENAETAEQADNGEAPEDEVLENPEKEESQEVQDVQSSRDGSKREASRSASKGESIVKVYSQAKVVNRDKLESTKNLLPGPAKDCEDIQAELIRVVKIFMPSDIDVDEPIDDEGIHLLTVACMTGFVKLTRYLIQSRCNVNQCDIRGLTPLMMAAKFGQLDSAKILNEATANVTMRSESQNSALIFAASGGHVAMVQFLRSPSASWQEFQDATILEKNESAVTALAIARHHGHEAVEAHLNRWAILELMTAAKNGDVARLENLVPLQIPPDWTYRGLEVIERRKRQKAEEAAKAAKAGGMFKAAIKNIKAAANALAGIQLMAQDSGGDDSSPKLAKDAEAEAQEAEVEDHSLEGNAIDMTEQTRTALQWAAAMNKLNIIEYLHEHKASLNAVDSSPDGGMSALMLACLNKHTGIAEWLLSAKASVNLRNRERKTAMMIAAQHGLQKFCRLLAENKADLDFQDNIGRTALIWSVAETPQINTVKVLKQFGCRGDLTDRHKRTALTVARQGTTAHDRRNNDKDPVKILEAWARDDVRIAAERGDMQGLRVFVPQDLDVDEQLDKDGRTAMSFAAQNGHLEMVKWLGSPQIATKVSEDQGPAKVQRDGASLNLREKKDHRTPLMFAASGAHLQICAWMISMKVNLAEKDIHGKTALHVIAEQCVASDACDCAKLLLDSQASVAAKDRRLETPIHIACREGGFEMVELLLERGATLTEKNIQGKTPSEVAAASGKTDVAEHLADVLGAG